MVNEMLVYIGTYTEPIRFGTGKFLEGKGEGIYVYRMDQTSGAMEPVSKATGITNPSYLSFDSTRRFLYAVNELKTYENKPTGTVSAFAVDPKTGTLKFLNKRMTHGTIHAMSLSIKKRVRVCGQFYERQHLRSAGAGGRQSGRSL